MVEDTHPEQSNGASNERAVAWARQMVARKRATQKSMEEEFKTNYKLQAALAKLRE
ncbi:hypothetical protein [Spirosoma gilvum]